MNLVFRKLQLLAGAAILDLGSYPPYNTPEYTTIAADLIRVMQSGENLDGLLQNIFRLSCRPCQIGDASPLIAVLLEYAGNCCTTSDNKDFFIGICKNFAADQLDVARYLGQNLQSLVDRAAIDYGLLPGCAQICLNLVGQQQDVGCVIRRVSALSCVQKETLVAQNRFGKRRLHEFIQLQRLVLQCLEKSRVYPVDGAAEIFCQYQYEQDLGFLDAFRSYRNVDDSIAQACGLQLTRPRSGNLCLLRLLVEEMAQEGPFETSFALSDTLAVFEYFLKHHGDIFFLRLVYESLYFARGVSDDPRVEALFQVASEKIPDEFQAPENFL